jgi:hypothetical protein
MAPPKRALLLTKDPCRRFGERGGGGTRASVTACSCCTEWLHPRMPPALPSVAYLLNGDRGCAGVNSATHSSRVLGKVCLRSAARTHGTGFRSMLDGGRPSLLPRASTHTQVLRLCVCKRRGRGEQAQRSWRMGAPFTPTWVRVSESPNAATAPPTFAALLLVKVQPVMLVAGTCDKTAPPLPLVARLPSKCACAGREARREAWEGVCERESEGCGR